MNTISDPDKPPNTETDTSPEAAPAIRTRLSSGRPLARPAQPDARKPTVAASSESEFTESDVSTRDWTNIATTPVEVESDEHNAETVQTPDTAAPFARKPLPVPVYKDRKIPRPPAKSRALRPSDQPLLPDIVVDEDETVDRIGIRRQRYEIAEASITLTRSEADQLSDRIEPSGTLDQIMAALPDDDEDDLNALELPREEPGAQPIRPPLPLSPEVRFYQGVSRFFLLGSLLLIVGYGVIWRQPQVVINPFPPPIKYIILTATPSSATSIAPIDSDAADGVSPTAPFALDTIRYIANQNGQGCDWSGVAGLVLDNAGQPLDGVTVSFSGAVRGDGIDGEVTAGSAPTYGEGGYEYSVGTAPQSRALQVQLLDADGLPLSQAVRIVTRARCEENVAFIQFVERNSDAADSADTP